MAKITVYLPAALEEKKIIIQTSNNFTSKNTTKGGNSLATGNRIPMHLERVEAVPRFRLTTGHDYLPAHLHRIGLASDGIRSLCGIANMDGDSLRNCTELIDASDDIAVPYWESRRRMAQQQQTCVG
ncbi:reverse transcriptase [Caerostris darwini]|uniref:Reverse transcriptase n=1 Tax=Caerostris darwini TaxID=1538125 RepID=A0AAV4X677_9ARAC|nr:reverse transcriptase [Caerostris darwini]